MDAGRGYDMNPLQTPVFLRGIERIYAQGPRAVTELVAEIAETFGRPHSAAAIVQQYSALPDGTLKALGVDQIPFPKFIEVKNEKQ